MIETHPRPINIVDPCDNEFIPTLFAAAARQYSPNVLALAYDHLGLVSSPELNNTFSSVGTEPTLLELMPITFRTTGVYNVGSFFELTSSSKILTRGKSIFDYVPWFFIEIISSIVGCEMENHCVIID